MLEIWNEGLAKSHTKKIAPPAGATKPAIHRLQIFYQLHELYPARPSCIYLTKAYSETLRLQA